MTISEYAFLESGRKLLTQESPIYFWTFTMREVYPDWYYGNIWMRFVHDLCDLYGGTLKGLKVVELHKDHGIHWHALLNKRVWIGEVRRIGKRYGIGHCWVEKRICDFGAVEYLSKYMSKDFKNRNIMYSRCPRWGTIGGFKAVRVKDVEVESGFHRRMEVARKATGLKKFPFLFAKGIFEWNDATDEQVRRAAIQFLKTNCVSAIAEERKLSYGQN